MQTSHKLLLSDSRNMQEIADDSVDLVVTSPPYPMIEMWDDLFGQLNPEISRALQDAAGQDAFELMNLELDKVWRELDRVVKPSGFVCINIGDATRTIGSDFALYSNHSRITHAMTELRFTALPVILWRKSTNAPNKFMGSGMLPAGAYVTLEHEYILIFRKGGKRQFQAVESKKIRNSSAFFWEERNRWFSDLWDLKGVKQELNRQELRQRSAAFPYELPYRLINMYSVKGDMVLDPFLGTGTTMFAAIATGRNSYGFECDASFKNLIFSEPDEIQRLANNRILERVRQHLEFTKAYQAEAKNLKYQNLNHGFLVMTQQELNLELEFVKALDQTNDTSIIATYESLGFVQETSSHQQMFEIKPAFLNRGQVSLF